MSDLVECQRCGRRVVYAATKKVGTMRVCPPCVAAATQEFEQHKVRKREDARRAKLAAATAKAKEREQQIEERETMRRQQEAARAQEYEERKKAESALALQRYIS